MAKAFLLEIVTPERKVFSREVNSIVAPGADGYFGVLPRHTPMLAGLGIGYLKVEVAGEITYFALSGGFCEVLPSAVKILAETAETASEIDVARAKQSLERAQHRIHEGRQHWELDRAQVSLARAANRLRVAEMSR